MPTALIWGASGGIGSALVTALKAADFTVIGAARDESRIPAGADVRLEFDAADGYSIKQAAYAAAQSATAIDLCVYAAGAMQAATVEQFPPAEWLSIMAANLTGAALTSGASIPLLRDGGALMLIGAYVDKITLPRFGAYAAAKAGLATLAEVLAKENRKLKVTLVRLPAVDTAFWANVPFKLPPTALKPDAVAGALLAHYAAGGSGTLDL